MAAFYNERLSAGQFKTGFASNDYPTYIGIFDEINNPNIELLQLYVQGVVRYLQQKNEPKTGWEETMNNIKLMNMCMIMDKHHQRVVAQDKVNGNWTGITFPGGKVEKGEGIVASTIREVKEETGLEVKDLQFSGLVHWYNDQTHERWLIFLFKTENYSGELLKETHEGKVFWVELAELQSMNLASGFEDYLRLYLSDSLLEAYGVWNDGGWGEFGFS